MSTVTPHPSCSICISQWQRHTNNHVYASWDPKWWSIFTCALLINTHTHRTKATAFAYHLPHTSKGQRAKAFLHLNPLIKASEPANYSSYMHVTLRDLLKHTCSTPHAALQHMRGRLKLIQGLPKDVEIKTTERRSALDTKTQHLPCKQIGPDIQNGCYLNLYTKQQWDFTYREEII